MSVKTIEFNVKENKQLINFLKKFPAVDNSVLLEINGKKQLFVANTYDSERTFVKRVINNFSDTNITIKNKFEDTIKVGIYNIPRLIKILEQFNKEFEFIIKYDEIINKNNEKEYAALSILIKNKELKFNNECSSLNVFNYIPEETWNNVICNIDSNMEFELSKENMDKVSSLCNLDKDYKFLEFKCKNSNIYVKGKLFEYLLSTCKSSDHLLEFYKDQFNKIDIENYTVKMGSDRLLLISRDSDTTVVMSKVEKNEDYEETNEDPFN